MEENLILVENKEKREELIGHLEVLDKVKAITYLTKDLIVTTEQAANFYDVDYDAIKTVLRRNKEEFNGDGVTVLRGSELKTLKEELTKSQNDTPLIGTRVNALTIITKRALLRIGMLLTESAVAEQVRNYLLNLEENATDEQKQEAFEETAEQVAEKLGIKKLKKQHREEIKLITVQSAIDRLSLFGLSKIEASYVIQKALAEKTNLEQAILNKVEELRALETNIRRGIIREKVDHIAVQHYDEDREMVYHLMSEKMREHIGFNMRAHRSRIKRQNVEKPRGCKDVVPSYLDIIVQYNAYEAANQVLQEIIDEKETLKAGKCVRPKEAVTTV